MTALDALRQLLSAAKQITADECKDLGVWNTLGGAIGVAEMVLRDGEPLGPLACYDAGLLSDYGGGNVDWWQDYIRAELDRAYDFYVQQWDDRIAAAPAPAQPAVVAVPEAILKRTEEIRQTMGNPTGIGRVTLMGYVEFLLAHIAFTNAPQPAAAPISLDVGLDDPWVVAARKADHFCPSDLSSPDKWRWKANYMRELLQPAAAPSGDVEPDMLWDDADTEGTFANGAEEFAENYAGNCMSRGDVSEVTIQCALRLPNRVMRIEVADKDDDSDWLKWEWVTAITATKE